MKRPVIAVIGVVSICSGAFGANWIREWSGHYIENVDYRIRQDLMEIVLLANSDPNIPWRFEAYDDVTGEPGVINDIRIEPTGPVGVIRLDIIGDPTLDHVYGAAHVKRIDLVTNADASNSLELLDITQDLGELGPTRAASITGDFVVRNNVLSDVSIQTLPAGAHFDVFGFALDGALSVTGEGPHGGDISVKDMYSYPYGNIEIAGTMAGSIDLGSDAGG